MVQRLKVLAALAEDPSLFPAPYQAAHNSCNFSFLPASIGTQTDGIHSLKNRQTDRKSKSSDEATQHSSRTWVATPISLGRFNN